ncbi:hypothetical protein CSV79_06905 [Sporosarcina sp. P13]|uniref:hypothetical protein n=1 Tax=Sporosarcina sp. P13 TaxID=2048263 RepID=UPI000C173A7F|nr:hypothetical protein [Sporosarcina sp. P13]PIC64352.1 hypothetical protein CSV79_06905 [Sporosarcina sp. P13]
MGYILPIQNFQSQQYAERLNKQPHNFASIGRVSPVRMRNEESNYWEDVIGEEDRRRKEQKEERNMKRAPQSLAKNGFIAPNPAKLSPTIAEVVGKGLSVNAYV